jgi:hypothetical protein
MDFLTASPTTRSQAMRTAMQHEYRAGTVCHRHYLGHGHGADTVSTGGRNYREPLDLFAVQSYDLRG